MKLKKLILTSIFAFIVFIIMPKNVSALSGARHYTDTNGNVFLGGNYIEVGISPTGIFGTTAGPDSSWGFHFDDSKASNGAYLGLIADEDGWDTGSDPVNGDFFTPGQPEERWIFSYYIDSTVYEYVVGSRSLSELSGWKETLVVTDTSSGNTLSAKVVGTTNENVKITITYSFNIDDLSYKTEVFIQNLSSSNLTNTRFVRSFDPDQDVWLYSSYDTYNKVLSNPLSTIAGGADNYAMVAARGSETLSSVFFLSMDNRARASHSVAFAPESAYLDGLWDSAPVTSKTYATEADITMTTSELNGYEEVDNAIAITTNFGSIEAYKNDSTEYITSLNPNATTELNKIISASSNSSIDYIIVENTDTNQYYALYLEDTLVQGWTKGTGEDIKFSGLTPNTKYTVKTISSDDYDADNNKPKEEATVQNNEITTKFDPLEPVDTVEPVITPSTTSISFKGLNKSYKYKLVDKNGRNVSEYKTTDDGNLVFDNLTDDTTYYLVALTSDNVVSEKVAVKTNAINNPKTFDGISAWYIVGIISIFSMIVLSFVNKRVIKD